jgi:hypothetical protein
MENKQGKFVNQKSKKITYYYDWDKSFKLKRNNNTEGVIVPIFEFDDSNVTVEKFNKIKKIGYSLRKIPRSIKVLYLNKDTKGKKTYQFVTYIPSKGATLADYSGHTIYSDLEGSLLGGVVVEHNKVVGNILDIKKQKNMKVNCGYWMEVPNDWWYVNGDGEFVLVHSSYNVYVDLGCGNEWQQDTAPPMDYGGGGDSSSGGDSGGESFNLQSTNENQDEETVYDDGSTKVKYYKWIFLKGNGVSVYSKEKGTMIPNDQPYGSYWMFSSFEHLQTGVENIIIGGVVTINSAIPHFEIGKFHTLVSLSYDVDCSIAYKGSPFTVNYNGDQSTTFSAN